MAKKTDWTLIAVIGGVVLLAALAFPWGIAGGNNMSILEAIERVSGHRTGA